MIQAAIQTDANTGNFTLHSLFFIKFWGYPFFIFHSIMASLERKLILPHFDGFLYKVLSI